MHDLIDLQWFVVVEKGTLPFAGLPIQSGRQLVAFGRPVKDGAIPGRPGSRDEGKLLLVEVCQRVIVMVATVQFGLSLFGLDFVQQLDAPVHTHLPTRRNSRSTMQETAYCVILVSITIFSNKQTGNVRVLQCVNH